MAYIQVRDRQYPLSAAVRIGTGDGVDVKLDATGGREGEATVELTRTGQALIRRAGSGVVKVNGVALGPEPTPLLHGDKIEIAGAELLFGDDQQVGSTQYVPSVDLRALQSERAAARAAKPTGGTGGRIVSLVDGREYPVPDGGLLIGRDAGCDVVVAATEVSRRHAEIVASGSGYALNDLSSNGVFVNGVRVDKSHKLGRGEVIRVGNEEFRFYADVAPQAAAQAATPTQPVAPAGAAASQPPVSAAPQPAVAAASRPPGAASSAPVPAPPTPPKAPSPAKAPATPADAGAAVAAADSRSGAPAAASAKAPPPGDAGNASAASAPTPVVPTSAAPLAPRAPLATLEIINEGVNKGRKFELRAPLSHVGRGAHNDVAIDDESVSDSHAKLQKRESGWFLVDMGSTNGTYVGGRRIDGEQRLEGSPDIRFGGVKMNFRPAAEPVDAGKGTRAIAATRPEDVRRGSGAGAVPASRGAGAASARRTAAGVPETAPPPSTKFPVWIVVAALVLVAVAAFFIMQGR